MCAKAFICKSTRGYDGLVEYSYCSGLQNMEATVKKIRDLVNGRKAQEKKKKQSSESSLSMKEYQASRQGQRRKTDPTDFQISPMTNSLQPITLTPTRLLQDVPSTTDMILSTEVTPPTDIPPVDITPSRDIIAPAEETPLRDIVALAGCHRWAHRPNIEQSKNIKRENQTDEIDPATKGLQWLAWTKTIHR